ncbi:MAG: hypothetical protein GXO86_09635 [Chlorobi bacterium]|nr:hypothetical protein [Chlorobiota bacterium]
MWSDKPFRLKALECGLAVPERLEGEIKERTKMIYEWIRSGLQIRISKV